MYDPGLKSYVDTSYNVGFILGIHLLFFVKEQEKTWRAKVTGSHLKCCCMLTTVLAQSCVVYRRHSCVVNFVLYKVKTELPLGEASGGRTP